MIMVIAGSYNQFVHWCYENNYHYKRDHDKVQYLWQDNVDILRGRRDIKIIYWGTWYTRSDISEIREFEKYLRMEYAKV